MYVLRLCSTGPMAKPPAPRREGRPPHEAAEAPRNVRAAAVQHRLDGEAACLREVGARAADRAAHVVTAARRREHRPVVRKGALELGAADRDQRVLAELELGPDDR